MSDALSYPTVKLSTKRGLSVVLCLTVMALVAWAQDLAVMSILRSAAISLGLVLGADRVFHWAKRWIRRNELRCFEQVLQAAEGPTLLSNRDGDILWISDQLLEASEFRIGANILTHLRKHSEDRPSDAATFLRGLRQGEDQTVTFGPHFIRARLLSENYCYWTIDDSFPVMSDLPLIRLGHHKRANTAGSRLFPSAQDFPDLTTYRSGQSVTLPTAIGPLDVVPIKLPTELGDEYLLLPDTVGVSAVGGSDFDVLPVLMVKLTSEGGLITANAHACKLLGIETGTGLALQDLMEGLGRSISDWLYDAGQGRGLNHPEFLRLTRRDKEVFVQVSLNKSTDAGQPILVAVLNDATELKTLEAQFVQSQKMQAIGQLAGGVAHDFNNLLTAISGHCDLLLLRHDASDLDYADLVQINQNANRAAALVSQLLAFSRKQTLRPESIDMRDTLADLTHLLNRLVGEKIELSLKYDPELRAVRADKRQLEQVIMNLVVNARDAMPNGGGITISTEGHTVTETYTRDRVPVEVGSYVSIKVKDQGCGIPPDKVQKIFEPFYTTKRTGEGTGLGLSTVYGIVKQTGGYVFVESTLEQGTEFTVLLPSAEIDSDPISEGFEPELPKRRAQEHGVILLVEDETPVRTFAARALQLRGYSVIEAACAEDALDILQDSQLKIDVFVTDVVMPGRDGPSWVKEALIDRPDVRVVFVSGYAEDSFEKHQAEIKNSVFLPKPFSLNELTDTVHQQLV